jgi:chromosomal replication initiation ATPase DnaA
VALSDARQSCWALSFRRCCRIHRNRLKTNIRQLEGTVKKSKPISNWPSITSVSIAQNAIRDILSDSQPISVTIERVIGEVSRYCEVSAQDIRVKQTLGAGITRTQMRHVHHQNVTQMSMASIGEEFGGRDTPPWFMPSINRKIHDNPPPLKKYNRRHY